MFFSWFSWVFQIQIHIICKGYESLCSISLSFLFSTSIGYFQKNIWKTVTMVAIFTFQLLKGCFRSIRRLSGVINREHSLCDVTCFRKSSIKELQIFGVVKNRLPRSKGCLRHWKGPMARITNGGLHIIFLICTS